ncbi:hypothetical protein D3C80_1799330 [compost metagenome]
MPIDDDPAFKLQPGAVGQFQIQLNADADNHQVEGLRGTAGAANPGFTLAIFKRDLAAVAMHGDALLLMQFQQRLGNASPYATHTQRGLALKHRHVNTQLAGRGGNLQPDPATTHNRQLLALL